MTEVNDPTVENVLAVDPGLTPDEVARVRSYTRSVLASSDPVSAVYRASRGTVSLTALPSSDGATIDLGTRELRVWAAVAQLVANFIQPIDRPAADALATRFQRLLRDYYSRISAK